MDEDGWDINTIGTRHAVFTIVARDNLQAHNLLGNLIVKIPHLLF
jgi:hypothetical protein